LVWKEADFGIERRNAAKELGRGDQELCGLAVLEASDFPGITEASRSSIWFILNQLRMNRQVLKMPRREQGFSLIEVIVVCVVILIIAALAIPNLMQVITIYKLDSSGRSMAGLLQQARLQAVQTNRPAYAQIDTSKTPNMGYVNADQSAYAIGNPSVAMSMSVTYTTTGTMPAHDQLDSYVGGSSGLGAATPEPPGAVIGFNARGLPCVGTSANPLVCSTLDASTSKPVAFEWFMQNNSGGWEAVTVTPAGRIKNWRLSGDPNAGNWQ
jgi:prepilin-type N-terminal cleavage/methylation domain-containing protein